MHFQKRQSLFLMKVYKSHKQVMKQIELLVSNVLLINIPRENLYIYIYIHPYGAICASNHKTLNMK